MSFADSFWTEDYHSGHEKLFGHLYEGIKENEDFIALFTKRMDSEYQYGTLLQSFPDSLKLLSKRHADNDYVSTVKNAFGEINTNFARQGSSHNDIASNINELVLQPFSRWCKEHEQRVAYSESVIAEKFKQYSTSRATLEKLQKRYFNKCRLVEEFKSHYTEDDLNDSLLADTSVDDTSSTPSGSADQDSDVTYHFGGSVYDLATTKTLLSDILHHIELSSHKVPILGTYHNVSTGSSITQWFLDNMPELRGNIEKAEAFGQDLVGNGFIRVIGTMGANKSFINSSQYHYQWKPAVFELTQISEFELSKSTQNAHYDPIAASGSRANQLSDYFEDVKQAIGVTSVDFNDKSQYSKLVKEASSLDTQYFETAKSLDVVRCEYEETVMDHLTFMQKCELDRLKAVKKATFDFVACFSNKISLLKRSCDELLLVEETMHPVSDLKFLIENYATGKFSPQVILYDNYYDSHIKQTFGVDLNIKARLDKKAVPVFIQTVLSYLDTIYPELNDDEERVNLWTSPVHLANVHQLRLRINDLTDSQQITEILHSSDAKTVTNLLKLYFMELPDSIVSHTFFDLINTLYKTYPENADDETANKSRVTGLQNTLTEMPVCNLATLDALLTHLNRLVQIISSKDEELGRSLKLRLCREFGGLVLRPKAGAAEKEGKNVHAFNLATESLQQKFINDLFDFKDTIFGELRRRNSKKPSRSNSTKSVGERNGSQRSKSGSTTGNRLESKLKKAVQNSTAKAAEKKDITDKRESSERAEETASTPPKPVLKDSSPSSTAPPTPLSKPTNSSANSLKRSTSPKKRKSLTIHLDKQSRSVSPTPSSVKSESNDEMNSGTESKTGVKEEEVIVVD